MHKENEKSPGIIHLRVIYMLQLLKRTGFYYFEGNVGKEKGTFQFSEEFWSPINLSRI